MFHTKTYAPKLLFCVFDSFYSLNAIAGPDVGGPHGPYRQSERKVLYKQYVDQLVGEGLAYPCFCTDEELEQCVWGSACRTVFLDKENENSLCPKPQCIV